VKKQNLNKLNNAPYNVCVFTWWHTIAGLMMIVGLPMGVTGVTIGIGIYIGLSEIILISLGIVLIFTCMLLFGTLSYRMLPKDLMHVENNALIGMRYGIIPFDSIVNYNLDDGRIKISRKGHATIRLAATKERRSYDEFYATFASAILAWQSLHPGSNMKQAYFYGSWKAKAVGGVLLLGSLGSAVAALALNAYGVLGVTLLGAVTGLYLMLSKRRNVT
jgi:hypothetical protein